MTSFKIFLIDEDTVNLDNQSSLLNNFGYHCFTFSDFHSAFKAIPVLKPRLIISKFPKITNHALNCLSQMRALNHKILNIVISEHDSAEVAVKSMKNGAFDYITIPFSNERLLNAVAKAKNQFEMTDEFNKELDPKYNKNEFNGIVSCCSEMKNIFHKIKKIAKTNANVLILGESGTGKELLARAIHSHSNQNDRQFIPVSCSALPNTLLESELFGYEKGAFTGAQSPKIGLIELANKGTLFLDEVTEIDIELQPKLLRFLQERKIRRLGGLKEINVDTRVLSASNTDPFKLLNQGKFREDLYYRLDVIRFELPPLRDRKEDIPLLVSYFINKFNKHVENKIGGIEEKALEVLTNYHWPGNIRQLENVIERTVIIEEKDRIQVHNLPTHIIENKTQPHKKRIDPEENFKEAKKKYIETFEEKYITELLRKHDGNISKAARQAGINRRTIYRMMEIYNISL